MTGRERLENAIAGGGEGQPAFLQCIADGAASEPANTGADGLVVRPGDLSKHTGGDLAVLAEILNPFGRALQMKLDLNTVLAQSPESGNAKLDELVTETREEIDAALAANADGIFYRLIGASPEYCTPMQYGGYYLERDRELLQSVADRPLNVLYIEGGDGAYLDFVSDLPAGVFAWDVEASGITTEEMRKMRNGALGSEMADGDVMLLIDAERMDRWRQEEMGNVA